MLSDRQLNLINAIISEYLNESEPVGSMQVVTKYEIGCSPATVRNEMAKLLDMGYLEMLHTSSGRVPTKQAYRLYLDEIMEEEELPVLQEVAMKQRLWPARFNFEALLRQAVGSLSEQTQELAFITVNEGYVVTKGAVNILDNKEFWDIDVAKSALTTVESYEILEKIFAKTAFGDGVRILLEDEIDIQNLDKCGFVFVPYTIGNKSGHLGVFGPSRMDYAKIVPAIKHTKKLLSELSENW